MKKLLLLTLLLMPAVTLWAQNTIETPKQIISEVKQAEEQYIYADKTSETVEEALKQAQELLLREVMDYLRQNGENMEDASAFLKDQMVTITIQRGDKFRAFVYIDKQFKTDVSEVKPITEKVFDTITVSETPTVEPTATQVDSTTETILRQIVSMTTRLQVYDFITQLQKDGEKVAFVTHPEAEELESMYVLLYKRGGDIEAILTPPDTQGQRYNITTGLPDAQANHPATSVNGFKLNE